MWLHWLSALMLIAFLQPGAIAETRINSNNGLATAATAGRPVKDKWAFVVGISKFRDARLNLKYPDKDAQDFYNYLVKDGQFAADHVVLLKNEQATRANVLAVLGDKWLPRLANPDDLVVIFMSTHGSPADADVGGVNYLLAHDTDLDCLYATGIPLQDLMRIIKARVHCDRVVIILDACHSGAANTDTKGLSRAGNVSAAEVMSGTGQLVIASSKPNQVSWEGKTYANGVFTKNLIESLKVNGRQTKISVAFTHLKERVQQEVIRDRGQIQTPELKSQWRGDELTLATSVSQPRAAIAVQLVDTPSEKPAPPVRASSLPPLTLLDNGNIYRVDNRPTNPTTFELRSQALLVYAFTYHWNHGKGKAPGSISLQDQDGNIFGPWMCVGKSGQGGVPNAYWECEPMVQLNPGRYTVIDSDPQTWSQNAASNGCGFSRIKAALQVQPTEVPLGNLKQVPIKTIFSNGNIYLVHNRPTAPTSFYLSAPTHITSITNYHWNNGKGKQTGSITLVQPDGTKHGPWRAMGSPGQGGVTDAYWRATVNQTLQPGLYTVLDSDVNTWSHNTQSGGAGMTEVQGFAAE